MSIRLPASFDMTTRRAAGAEVARVAVDTVAVGRVNAGEAAVATGVEVAVEVAVGEVAAATEVRVSGEVAAGDILEFTRPTNRTASTTTGTAVFPPPEVRVRDSRMIDSVAEDGITGEVAASAVGVGEVDVAAVGNASVRVAAIARVTPTQRHLDAFRVVVDSGRRRATATGVATTADDIDGGTATPTVEVTTADAIVPPAVPAAGPAAEEAARPRVANGIRGASVERVAPW